MWLIKDVGGARSGAISPFLASVQYYVQTSRLSVETTDSVVDQSIFVVYLCVEQQQDHQGALTDASLRACDKNIKDV